MSQWYRSREGPSEFERGYWEQKTDPDGQVRNLTLERERKLEDMRDELAYVNSLPAGRILDVGCGLGHFLSAVDPKHERVGFDVSRWSIDWAKAHYDGPSFIYGDDLWESVRDLGRFDCVVLYHVIEHVMDPSPLMRSVAFLTAESGSLVLGTPDFDSPCARLFGEHYRLLHDPTHITLFNREGLVSFISAHWFDVERVETPFFGTRHATFENVGRMLGPYNIISPPFVGNILTVYARRR